MESKNLLMPLAPSSLSPEVSVISSIIARYSAPRVCSTQCLQPPQQMKTNKESIESLAPRVEALAELLCAPAPEGDTGEKSRRNNLERYALFSGIVNRL